MQHILPLTQLSVNLGSLQQNHYICGVIQTKCHDCPLPSGVFKPLLTLLSFPVIPLIYYGMVIGWGVAMTHRGQNMNQVGQSISVYRMTPERSQLLKSMTTDLFLKVTDGALLLVLVPQCFLDKMICLYYNTTNNQNVKEQQVQGFLHLVNSMTGVLAFSPSGHKKENKCII